MIDILAFTAGIKHTLTSSEWEEDKSQEYNAENEQYQELPQVDKLEEIYQNLQRKTFKIPQILDEEALTMRQELAEHTTNELK